MIFNDGTMETKNVRRVELKDEEINAVRREMEAEGDSKHHLTGIEAAKLAESIRTWQYESPDSRKTSLIGSYSGSIKVDDIEVTVRLMKDHYVSEFCEVEYVYTMTAFTKDIVISDRSYDTRSMAKKLYEQLDSEHNALLKEMRKTVTPEKKSKVAEQTASIRAFLSDKR